MDVAVDLVQAFLRFNGYLTVSEWQIQTLNKRGEWETLTDVDILALRFPGEMYLTDVHDADQRAFFNVPGLPLFLEDDTIDVIIGEVKEGEALLNPKLTHHKTLHTVLGRIEWMYGDGDMDKVVADLAEKGVCYTPARGGGTIRTRLVAFGRAPEATLNIVPLGLILERLSLALDRYEDLLRSARFSSPSAATLKLLHKTGFRLSRDSEDAPDSD